MTAVLLRYPPEVTARLDALLPLVKDDADFKAMRLSRSALLRMALYEGLETLEKRYGISAEAE
jgi:hypothetical protein